MGAYALLFLASLCGSDPHETLRLNNPSFGISFQPYELVYKTDRNKSYRVRMEPQQVILQGKKFEPEKFIAACTRVG